MPDNDAQQAVTPPDIPQNPSPGGQVVPVAQGAGPASWPQVAAMAQQAAQPQQPGPETQAVMARWDARQKQLDALMQQVQHLTRPGAAQDFLPKPTASNVLNDMIWNFTHANMAANNPAAFGPFVPIQQQRLANALQFQQQALKGVTDQIALGHQSQTEMLGQLQYARMMDRDQAMEADRQTRLKQQQEAIDNSNWRAQQMIAMRGYALGKMYTDGTELTGQQLLDKGVTTVDGLPVSTQPGQVYVTQRDAGGNFVKYGAKLVPGLMPTVEDKVMWVPNPANPQTQMPVLVRNVSGKWTGVDNGKVYSAKGTNQTGDLTGDEESPATASPIQPVPVSPAANKPAPGPQAQSKPNGRPAAGVLGVQPGGAALNIPTAKSLLTREQLEKNDQQIKTLDQTAERMIRLYRNLPALYTLPEATRVALASDDSTKSNLALRTIEATSGHLPPALLQAASDYVHLHEDINTLRLPYGAAGATRGPLGWQALQALIGNPLAPVDVNRQRLADTLDGIMAVRVAPYMANQENRAGNKEPDQQTATAYVIAAGGNRAKALAKMQSDGYRITR